MRYAGRVQHHTWFNPLPVLVALSACGARTGLISADALDAGPADGAAGSGGVAGAGGKGGGAGHAGNAGAGAGPACYGAGDLIPARPVGAACSFEGNGALGIAVASGSRLYGIDGAGNVMTYFTFGQNWPFEPGNPIHEVVESRGGYLGAAVAVTPKGDPNPTQAAIEYVVTNWAGEVKYHAQRTVPYASSIDLRIHGNEQGIFAFGLTTAGTEELAIVGVKGEVGGPWAGMLPISDPDASGRIAVLRDQQRFWFDPCSNTLVSILAGQLDSYTSVEAQGPVLLWVDPKHAQAVLETADIASKAPFGIPAPVSLFRSHPSHWELAASEASIWTFGTANVTTGESRQQNVVVPAGLRRFGSFGTGIPGFDSSTGELALDSQGRLVLGLRDASVGWLYVSSDGASWSPVSLPVGEVLALEALERAGTYLIAGNSMGVTKNDWEPAPAGIGRVDGQQIQLVRPESATSIVLVQAAPGTGFVRTYAMSADGGCTGTLLDSSLEITSAVTGKTTVLTIDPFSPTYGAWTFVPGPVGTLRWN
ncbi:MAG: hypothetical protein HY898_26695 [Deltaproteobacteria bacterium]|nr:hypothetical protein [Deltaproteobacteria bacterium]